MAEPKSFTVDGDICDGMRFRASAQEGYRGGGFGGGPKEGTGMFCIKLDLSEIDRSKVESVKVVFPSGAKMEVWDGYYRYEDAGAVFYQEFDVKR